MEPTETIAAVRVIGEVADSLLCEIRGVRTAIPRALILPGSEVGRPGDRGKIVVPAQFAFDLGLAPEGALAQGS